MIDNDLLKMNIEANSEIELNINELLVSAEEIDENHIRVTNKEVTMIFNKDYEMVECYGNTITVEPEINECEVK